VIKETTDLKRLDNRSVTTSEFDTRTAKHYRVSAIVSVYNSELWLESFFEDLFAQTLYQRDELEIVVVDSASTDRSWELIERGLKNRPHIRAISTRERESLYLAWNRAIVESTGSYITNANTDDRHAADSLEALADELDSNLSLDMVYGDALISRVANQPFDSVPHNEPYRLPTFFAPSLLLYFGLGNQPMWRRIVHNKVGGFDSSYRASGDWDFAVRVAASHRIGHVQRIVGSFYVGESNISYKDGTMAKEDERFKETYRTSEWLEKLYAAEGFTPSNARDRARMWLDMGIRAMEFINPMGGRRFHLGYALACFQEADLLTPEWAAPRMNMGVCFAIAGQKAKAVEIWESLPENEYSTEIAVNRKLLEGGVKTHERYAGLRLAFSDLEFLSQWDLANAQVSKRREKTNLTPDRQGATVESGDAAMGNGVQQQPSVPDELESRIARADQRLASGNPAGAIKELIAADARHPGSGLSQMIPKIIALMKPVPESGGSTLQPDAGRLQTVLDDPETVRASASVGWLSKPGARVSVVMPCYNNSRTLSESLHSILVQSDRDLEIIIVDDGSEDGSQARVQKFIAEYPEQRILFIERQNSGGKPGLVRNHGIRHARGTYVLPLDSDDLLLPDTLERMVRLILPSGEKEAVVHGYFTRFGERVDSWPTTSRPVDRNYLLRHNQLSNTSLYHRSLWEKVGGYSDLTGYEDWEFWIASARMGADFILIPECTFLVRIEDDQSVNSRAKRNHERLLANLMMLHRDLYEKAEVEWAEDFLLRHQQDGVGKEPHLGNDRFPLATALLVAAWPNYYTDEEQKWAGDYLKNHPPKLKNGLKKGLFPPARHQVGDSQKPVPEGDTDLRTHKNGGEVKRVLFLCHDFPPHRFAGAQLYAMQLAKLMKSRGVHVDVFHPVMRGEFPPDYSVHQDVYEDVDVFKLSKPPHQEHEKFYQEEAGRAFGMWLDGREYDLVHVHGLGQLTVAPLLEANRRGLPIMMTMHDFWLLCDQWHMVNTSGTICSGPESPEKCAACYLKLLGRPPQPAEYQLIHQAEASRRNWMLTAFEALDIAVAPSRFFANRYAQYGMPGVRHHPISIKSMEPMPKQKREKVRFGFFGQIISRKGVDLLVEAFSHPDLAAYELHLYGKVYEESFGQQVLAVAKSLPNILVGGAYDPAQLPQLYSEVDVAVVPSRMDNYPITVLEAFLNRTPVVGSNVGGIPELIQEGRDGILFASESVEDLRRALLQIASDPEAVREMSARMSMPRTQQDDVEATLELYDETIKRRREENGVDSALSTGLVAKRPMRVNP